MIDDRMADNIAKQNFKMVGTIRQLSLNLLAKWRSIRESDDLGKRYRLRPRLTCDYSPKGAY